MSGAEVENMKAGGIVGCGEMPFKRAFHVLERDGGFRCGKGVPAAREDTQPARLGEKRPGETIQGDMAGLKPRVFRIKEFRVPGGKECNGIKEKYLIAVIAEAIQGLRRSIEVEGLGKQCGKRQFCIMLVAEYVVIYRKPVLTQKAFRILIITGIQKVKRLSGMEGFKKKQKDIRFSVKLLEPEECRF